MHQPELEAWAPSCSSVPKKENDESVCLLIAEFSVLISKCTTLTVDLNAPLLCTMGE